MVIARTAVRQFLNRTLRDSKKIKSIPRAELKRRIRKLEPIPFFYTLPFKHQRACFLLGVKHPKYVMLLDMGLGKTKVMLDLHRWRIRQKKARRMLVLVPNVSNVTEWAEQVPIHQPKLTFAGLSENVDAAERREMVEGDAQVTVMTYAGLLRFVCKSVVVSEDEEDEERKWVLDRKLCREFAKRFDTLVLDESTFARTHTTLFSRAIRAIRKNCIYRYALTGTPFGNDPEALWNQFFLVDDGDTLGPTLGLFRAAFFREIEDYWSSGYKYVFRKRMRRDLHRMLRHGSIRYSEAECNDLPKRVPILSPVIFPQETWAYHKRIQEELSEAGRSYKLRENAWHRSRQITAGFLGVRDPEGTDVEIVFKHNPKLDSLISRLQRINDRRKVVVFNEYRKSGDIIEARLKKERIKFVRVYGGSKRKKENILRFKTDSSVKVLLINSQSGAFGLNLQAANYVIFFESPTCPIIRRQAEKRCHRTGQKRKVFIIDLVVKGSIDERILKSIAKGKDLFKTLVEGKYKRKVKHGRNK